MIASKEAIKKVVQRRIAKKEKILSDIRQENYKELGYIKQVDFWKDKRTLLRITEEDLRDLDRLLARAEMGERLKLNWVEVKRPKKTRGN